MGLEFYPVSTQTYPRSQEFSVLSVLAGLGSSLNKLSFDIRVLQSPLVGEAAEPFGESQVGSSAMPFKRNPINTEKVNSLARSLAQFPRVAWDNAAFSLLERTMDDSANRRTILPEAFLITEEMLIVVSKVVNNLFIDKKAITRNLDSFGPFAATERVLMALSKAGANRQEMHERLRKHSIRAWKAVRNEVINPLEELISTDPIILSFIDKDQIISLMDYHRHIGDAPQKAEAFGKFVQQQVKEVGR
jgi:adenylosuccinate lyase